MPNIAPYPRTCLTLDRYARILGVNPVHFQMSYTTDVYPITGSCDDVWYRYAWQMGDRVSLDEIALEISTAERDIQNFINYPLCPTWICDEAKGFPRHYRPEVTRGGGRDVRGFPIGINARWFKVRNTGVRGTEELELDAPIVYSDEDGDGFEETATITYTYDPETFTYPDCEVKVYVAGTNADQRWEVRYARQVVRDTVANTITFTFDTWMFVDPDQQARAPLINETNVKAIDLDDPLNLQQVADIYAEFTDATSPAVIFYWESLSGGNAQLPFGNLCVTCNTNCSGACGCSCCIPCGDIAQTGCLTIRDREASILVPHPASYDEDTEAWSASSFLDCRNPDRIRMWYKAGDASNDYLCGNSCDPLSDYMAETVAMLATSRLKRSFCGCCGATAKADYWQTDMARQGEDESFLFEFSLTANPFGTKIGEMQAFRRLSAFNIRKLDAALV